MRINFKEIALYTPIFFVLLAVGILGGRAVGMFVLANKTDHRPQSAPLTIGNGQRNLVVFLLDNLAAQHPRVEGIWLLITYPQSSKLTLVPIFPEAAAGTNASKAILDAMDTIPVLKPSTEILNQLSTRVLWDDYLIIDRKGSASILNMLHDSVEETHASPSRTETFAVENPMKPSGVSLDQQLDSWNTACTYMQSMTDRVEFTSLLAELFPLIITSLDWDNLPLIPWDAFQGEAGINCEFPTLNVATP